MHTLHIHLGVTLDTFVVESQSEAADTRSVTS